jgi:flavodoxin
MGKVLIAYFSRAGNTEKMAEYIAEGVRMAGHQAVLKRTSDIKDAKELEGYDGYIFGSPTYYLTVAEPMKTFLFMAEKEKADLQGKLAGAFGSYTHDGNAPGMVFDTMQYVFGMAPFELGAFKLKEHELAIFDGREPAREAVEQVEAMRACQQYGKVFAEKLGK